MRVHMCVYVYECVNVWMCMYACVFINVCVNAYVKGYVCDWVVVGKCVSDPQIVILKLSILCFRFGL